MKGFVDEQMKESSIKIRKLVTAAMAVYRSRGCDLATREHCLIMHIALGNDHVRAHNGLLHMYTDGAWTMYNGVVAENVMSASRRFLLHLEGLFLYLSSANAHCDTDTQLVAACKSVIDGMAVDTPDAVLFAFEERALKRSISEGERPAQWVRNCNYHAEGFICLATGALREEAHHVLRRVAQCPSNRVGRPLHRGRMHRV